MTIHDHLPDFSDLAAISGRLGIEAIPEEMRHLVGLSAADMPIGAVFASMTPDEQAAAGRSIHEIPASVIEANRQYLTPPPFYLDRFNRKDCCND